MTWVIVHVSATMFIFQWGPFMTKTTTDGVDTYVGMCYDLLNEMAATLNFRYVFSRRLSKSNISYYRVTVVGPLFAEIVNINATVRLFCSYTLVEPADLKWGDIKNGTYNGLIGQLQRKVS